MCLLVCFWLLFDILESVASTSSWLWVETGVLCSPCKTRKDCFQVSRCTLLVNELKETKAWVPWTRLQAEGFPGMPEGLLLHPVLGLIALFQPWRFCRAGIGPAAISAGTAAASKSRRVPLACAVQLLAGRLVPPMGSGSLFIILLMSVSCSVSVKGRSLLEWRSTFLHKQKRLCDRIAGTWQDIDRGGGNWCGWLIRSYFGVPWESVLLLASTFGNSGPPSGIFICRKTAFLQFLPQRCFPGEFAANQPFGIPASHLPSGRIQLEKKESYSVGIWILLLLSSLALLPFLSRACFLKEKRTYQPKDSIATFSSLSPTGRKLKLN